MAKKCSCDNCELEIYEDSDRCILHCDKARISDHQLMATYYSFEVALKELIVKNQPLLLNKVCFPFQESNNMDEYDSIFQGNKNVWDQHKH